MSYAILYEYSWKEEYSAWNIQNNVQYIWKLFWLYLDKTGTVPSLCWFSDDLKPDDAFDDKIKRNDEDIIWELLL